MVSFPQAATTRFNGLGGVPTFDPLAPTIPGAPQGPGLPCEIPTPIPGVVFCAGTCRCAGVPIPTPFGTGCLLGSCLPPISGDPGPGAGIPGDPFAPGFPGLPPKAPKGGGGCPALGAGTTLACPAGCHPNKSDYFLRGGAFVPKGSRCVRNRRRNPLNPRALDRAAGRLRSAKRAGSFLAKVVIPKRR